MFYSKTQFMLMCTNWGLRDTKIFQTDDHNHALFAFSQEKAFKNIIMYKQQQKHMLSSFMD